MKIRIVYLIACMMLAASMPSALAVISYGGTNVEVPAGFPAIAEGDSNLIVDWGGAIGFGTYTAGPISGAIATDPFALVTVPKYAHAWVFAGAYAPGAYAEWKGVKEANSYDVVDGGAAQGTYSMKAKVDGQAIAAVTMNPLMGGTPYAESLIDAFAAETTGPRQLWGSAQITSAVFHNGDGTAMAGTTMRNTIGTTQPEAKASFAAERAINYGGSLGIPARILGSAQGVTNLEAKNVVSTTAAGTSAGFAIGYSSINSEAWTNATDTGFQSGTRSEVVTQTSAARTAGTLSAAGILASVNESKVVGGANGEASAQAWDPAADWFTPKTLGTESAYSSVSGHTISSSQAYKVGDFTSGLFGGPVTAQILSIAGDETDVTGAPLKDGRDALALTFTDAYVFRLLENQDNYVGAETFIADGNAKSYGKDAITGNQKVQTELTNVQQSSGGHSISLTEHLAALQLQGSTAGLVARATFDPSNLINPSDNLVDLGIAGGLNLPFLHSGLYTQGPDWTQERWDDAGSYLMADSQSATSTSSAGTYSISASPVSVTEWIAGNDPTNNMYVTTPISISTVKPVNALIFPVDNPTNYGNPDFYGWSGAVLGDE